MNLFNESFVTVLVLVSDVVLLIGLPGLNMSIWVSLGGNDKCFSHFGILGIHQNVDTFLFQIPTSSHSNEAASSDLLEKLHFI